MPFTSQWSLSQLTRAAPNHPLSFFEPDANGTWADGQWRIVDGTYNFYVGTSVPETLPFRPP